ncbi:peptidase [Mycolicibacterium wolinskyi]|uniref:Peptidase n=1 Tax=Mycolicibacterium wolinskyi TaxID=59750 RepID=A0A132PFI8_9MYCO|nr:peptidase [Mycolicibacterium wolinskyi]KWX21091.1 peptidase [Mycolicibacterium wolinskyi]
MRRSTTSAGTDVRSRRPALAVALLAETGIAAALLVSLASPEPAQVPTPPGVPAVSTTPTADPGMRLPDGRTAALLALGGRHAGVVLDRIRAELPGAVEAVTAFWGPDWRRDIVIAVAASDEQFRVLAGGVGDIAATTTAERIMFAPGAAAMSQGALRIVLRHELFHYAARSQTAADAPRWLTEGVADYVGRPATDRRPQDAGALGQLPTDADLDSPGAARSLAYDRAWWFSRYVAETYGVPTLRALYVRACGIGHPDVATAVRDTLGADIDEVVAGWRRWLSG